MSIGKILFLFYKKLTLRRKFEIIGVLILLIVLSNSELIGLLIVKETISSLATDINTKNLSINFIYKLLPSNFSYVEKNAILLVFFTLNTLIFRVMTTWFSLRIVARTTNEVATLAFKNLIYQPYKIHLKRNSSEVVSLLTFDAQRAGDLIGNILLISTSLSVSIGIVIGLFLVNWKLSTFSFLIVISFYLSFNLLFKKNFKSSGKFITDSLDLQTRVISESIGNIRNVLLDHNQKFYYKFFQELNLKIRLKGSKVIFATVIPRYLIESIGLIALATYLFFVSKSGMGLQNTLSYIGAIAYGSQKLLPSINTIYTSFSDIIFAQGPLEKIIKALYIDFSEENFETIDSHKKETLNFDKIKLENIYFNFESSKNIILKDIDMSIYKGSKIGLIGETGSGKSTFIDLVMGLLEPSEGEILIDGRNLFDDRDKAFLYNWRSIIAHVPQSIFISDTTIEENIALGIDSKLVNKELLKESARISELWEFIESTQYKFKTFVGEGGSRLSGGQRQRIGIARAIYKKPKLLIFDEATSALDNNTEKKIIKNINDFSSDITLLMIAHRLSTLEICDHIYEIKNKKIIYKGTPKNLF
tara:strand:- start:367 stop:2130 length:1764 start_codon:yes stop_codon:yes gene_type:complete